MSNLTGELTALTEGRAIPRLGSGTGRSPARTRPTASRTRSRSAISTSTRAHVENEAEVGAGIAASSVDRGEVWLTTKARTAEFEPARVKPAVDDSLRSLRMDYIDLLLLHWPNPDVPLEHTLQALGELQQEGKIRHADVSNFPAACSSARSTSSRSSPTRSSTTRFWRRRCCVSPSSAPHDHGLLRSRAARVPRNPELTAIGEAHGKSAGQVTLRLLLDQPNVTTVPKASSHERRLENFEVFDFELTDADRERIAALPRTCARPTRRGRPTGRTDRAAS